MLRIKFQGHEQRTFYRDVRSQVRQRLRDLGSKGYADWRLAAKAGLFLAVALLSYCGILLELLPPLGLLLLALVFGLSSLLLLINVAHDAVHDALTPYPGFNRLVYTLLFALIGVDGRLWHMRHVRSHHVFPNVLGCDADIDHNGLIRLSPHHPRRWFHRAQHIYGPMLYPLVNLHSIFVQDLVYLFKRRLANMVDIRHSFWNYVQFFGLKLLYFTLILATPLALTSLTWWQVLVGYTVMTAAVSLVFVFLLIGTHFARETVFPALDPQCRLPFDWATHAVVTALDWNPRSRLANFLVGGTNTHVAHHLFPKICHVHYVEIDQVIKRVARNHGLAVQETTFFGMVRSHIGFLKDLGRADGDSASGASVRLELAREIEVEDDTPADAAPASGLSALRESPLSVSLGPIAAPPGRKASPWARSSRAS